MTTREQDQVETARRLDKANRANLIENIERFDPLILSDWVEKIGATTIYDTNDIEDHGQIGHTVIAAADGHGILFEYVWDANTACKRWTAIRTLGSPHEKP